MCKNQLGRRNLTEAQKSYLRGKQYEAEKMTHGCNTQREHDESGEFAVCLHFGDIRQSARTKDCIAKSFSVGSSTVERAEHFVDGLNVAEKVSPGIKEAVLSGSVKAPKSIISEIRNAPEEKKREALADK